MTKPKRFQYPLFKTVNNALFNIVVIPINPIFVYRSGIFSTRTKECDILFVLEVI